MRTADLPDARPTESATERGVDQRDGISYHPVIRGLTTLGGAVQDFLVHARGDSVGVAVKDLSAGAQVQGRYHEGDAGAITLDLVDSVALGHKIALVDIPTGGPITKYGVRIGRATTNITAGQHVHVHNLKGERWA